MKLNNQVISGKSILLRTFQPSDITSEYLSWLNDPEVVRYSNQRFVNHTKESSRKYLRSFQNSDNLFLAICLHENGQVIGTINSYISYHHSVADMGILIGNRSFWGNGLGTIAWELMMNFLHNDFGIRKVTGGTLSCNIGMIKIMESNGMHQDGVRRNHELVDGKEYDIFHYAKFRTSF